MKQIIGLDGQNGLLTGQESCTLLGQHQDYKNVPEVIIIEHHPQDSRTIIAKDQNNVQSLTGRMGTGGNNIPLIIQKENV